MRILELSANKIARIENLREFPSLEELYLNKNRIAKIENLEAVSHITLLGLSVLERSDPIGEPDHQDREPGVAGAFGAVVSRREQDSAR